MKRSEMPARRRPIRRRSSAGSRYDIEYKWASQAVHARSGRRCEIRSPHDCSGVSTEVHHRKLRSQGGSNRPSNLLDVCASGHRWLHRILPRAEAERLQLIVPRETSEYPYDPEGVTP